ncbi:hypothetical protein TNCV_4537581 [Trichonephila clavipes]|nr:hypothetical protein TNCV_4537581 [Trichonephila clavipes]
MRSLRIKNISAAHRVERLATLTTVPLGLGSNPGEDMDVCKCIVPSQHGSTLNSRRAASPLVRWWKGKRDIADGVLQHTTCHLPNDHLTLGDFFLWECVKDKEFVPPLPVDSTQLKQHITVIDSDPRLGGNG